MTTDITQGKDRGHEGRDSQGRDHLVNVEINGGKKEISRGEYTGRTLKVVLGVPQEHELDLVVKGEFRPIGDDQVIKIKGGEKFVSHVGQGSSS